MRKRGQTNLAVENRPVPAAVLPPVAESQEWGSRELVATLAHDMRAPLATITTSAELLEQELPGRDFTYFVGVIQRQAFRLQQMVQDLSEYANLPTAGMKLRRDPVDLVDIVREVCTEFQKFRMSHRLEVELPDQSIPAELDSEKIRRVLQNLLSNAFQYAPANSKVRVRLRAGAAQDEAVFEVEDEGPGIPEAYASAVFEPFFRVGNEGAGQGLGLFIVRRFSEAHGGRVWVEPGSELGARFCVALPVSN
jgi:signal transduction histidine kinase